jgi:cell division septum initiation protein DivIVA
VISRDITGAVSGGANQLFDLLSFVSNPELYATKVKELQGLIEKNEKYVEAVAKVDQISGLHADAVKMRDEAREALSSAQAAADKKVKDASEQAENLFSNAKAKADLMISEATKMKADAEEMMKKSVEKQSQLSAFESSLLEVSSSLVSQEKDLKEKLASARAANEEAALLKKQIIAKHRAFIEGL